MQRVASLLAPENDSYIKLLPSAATFPTFEDNPALIERSLEDEA